MSAITKKNQRFPKIIEAKTKNGTIIRLEKVSKKEIEANRPSSYPYLFK